MKKLIHLVCLTLCTISLSAQPKVVAHRGYWKCDNSAQNSLTALRRAAEIGVYGSECDVWMTSDKRLIVNHDKVFKGYDMEVTTSDTLLAIEIKNGETIPTLETYLKAAKDDGVLLIIEIKSRGNILAPREIARIVKENDMSDRVEIIVWSALTGREAIRLLPDTPVYYLTGDMTPAELKEFGFAGLDYSMKVIKSNPEWVSEAHKLGLKVNVWTVNSQEDMLYFIKLGVDFITTDQPEELQKLIARAIRGIKTH